MTALAYQSMMSLVPFIAIGLYLTNGVGIADQFHAFLNANISNQKLIEDLVAASDKIIATAESGLFGFISMASFLWILIWLMITVRRVFNNVWKVDESRRFFHVLGVGLGVLILSPFVIVLFFSGSVVYSTVLDYIVPSALPFSDHLKSFLSWALFAGASVLILTVMYKCPCPDASRLQGGVDRGHRLYRRTISLPGDAGDGGQTKRHLRLPRGPALVHDLAEPGMDHRPVRGRALLFLPKCKPFEPERVTMSYSEFTQKDFEVIADAWQVLYASSRKR